MHTEVVEVSVESILYNLRVGDIIEFASLSQSTISDKRFFIHNVRSVRLDNNWNHVFYLREIDKESNEITMSLDNMDGYASISRAVPPELARDIVDSQNNIQKHNFKEWKEWISWPYAAKPKIIECTLYGADYRAETRNNSAFVPCEHGQRFIYECFAAENKGLLLDVEIFEHNINAYLTLIAPAHEAIVQIASQRASE